MNRIVIPALLAALGTCSAQAGTPLPPMAQLGVLGATTREWAREHDFNGVIMASAPGRQPYQLTRGIAGPETERTLAPDTRFQTGSVEKYFAAIAVFALVDEGVLELDTPISAYLPHYRSDIGERLTLRHLLSNRSGLPNDILQAFRRAANGEREAVDEIGVSEAVSLFASGDLGFEPGSQFDYVLSNWLLVQHLLETVTGMPYPQVRARYVFEPAGMIGSGGYIHDLYETDPPVDNVAIGFDPRDPEGRGDYWSPRFFKGSYTTAADMIALERALDDGRLMSERSLDLFRTLQAPGNAYAFGGRYSDWDVCGESHYISTQSGSNGATTITSAFDTQTGYAVAIMSNVDESQGEMFALSAQLIETMAGCR